MVDSQFGEQASTNHVGLTPRIKEDTTFYFGRSFYPRQAEAHYCTMQLIRTCDFRVPCRQWTRIIALPPEVS